MGLKPELLLALECTVCLQVRDHEDAEEAATAALLFGARRWAICPCCGRNADFRNAAYRVRARAWTGQLSYTEAEADENNGAQ